MKRALALVSVAVLPLLLLPSAMSAAEGPHPGLPIIPDSGLGTNPERRQIWAWANAAQVGRAGSPVALQWGRIPLSLVATNSDFRTREAKNEAGHDLVIANYDIYAFLVPENAEERYGTSPTIQIRTVAFGSIPVEVSMQLRQRTDSDGLPVGLHFRPTWTVNFTLAEGSYPPMTLTDEVELAIVDLTLDGVEVSIDSSCSTGPSAELSLASDDLVLSTTAVPPPFDQDHGFSGTEGGTLHGALDIPAFSGCTTAEGDDLSQVLTTMVSGPDNPVTVKLGILGCFPPNDPVTGAPVPARPGTTFDEVACQPDLNESVKGIPDPLPFPNHAPGAPAP